MYPNYSLYPGGAFMMCESVSEFDDAVRPPGPVSAQQSTEMIRKAHNKDPVMWVIGKLGPIYEEQIAPLLNMTYGDEDINIQIGKFERVAEVASNVANIIRCTAVKQKAVLDLYNGPNSPTMDSFNHHIGLFMKNVEFIRQQGIEHSRYNYNAMPAFNNMWETRSFVNLFSNRPEMLCEPIMASTLKPFYGENYGRQNRIVRSFEGMVDLISCVYKDMDRMARLEAVESQGIDFNDLMSGQRYGNPNERPYRGDEEDMVRVLLRLISHTLRNISMSCYDSICSITDSEGYDIQKAAESMKVALMQTVNIFAIGTVVVMTMATQLRECVAHENAIKSYTELLLNTLKTV